MKPSLLAALLVLLAGAGPGLAATLQVDGSDPGCDDVSGNPFCEVGAAVAAAQDGDLIEIAPGTYAGDLTIFDDLILRGADPETTKIVGGSTAVLRIFGDVVLENLTLSGNTERGLVSSGESVRLIDCVIEDNGPASGGGGILLTGGDLILEETIVRGNTSDAPNVAGGAGLWMQGGTLFVTESEISDNHNLNAASPGGGLKIDAGSAIFANTTISDNTSSNNGGGLSIANFDGVTLDASAVLRNEAAAGGGGIHVAGPLTVRNSTLSGNRASGDAAIVRFALAFPVTLENVTIHDNESTSGGTGGVNLGAESLVANSILAGNRNLFGPSDCTGALGSLGYNLVQAPGCTLGGDLTGNQIGIDPRLYPLVEGAGVTAHHPFPIDSPVVDTANPLTEGSSCPVVDQRALPRPEDGNDGGEARCDVGSVELRTPLHYDGFESGDTSGWDSTVAP